ncbi:MAG: double-strand break repair protein AddB [Candidatus Devosia symbiotica]|nr:double-strand break repair protein AddB [Candidatus Devosia symbiotica]
MTLYSIAPHARFIATLADRVIDSTLLGGANQSQPFWLTDVTIVLPTRRAKLALAEEFARRGHGLLPDIRTFGGEVEDEEPFLPPFDAPVPLPAASGLERCLVLSRLVDAWAKTPDGRQAFSSPPTAGEILSMAKSLGLLIDDLLTEERTADHLKAMASDMASNLSAYWLQTLNFLDIALRYWPDYLAGKKADIAYLRGQRLDRQALAMPLIYGDRPIIAAGSTGSIPATARLLKAINGLPRGAVVLPGLDCAMSAADHAALLDDANNPHGHPQFGLARLLRSMGAAISDVTELAAADHPRTTLVHRALALTKDTARWSTQCLSPNELTLASENLSVIRARTEDEQARAVALAARQALADNKTVGIVTPDRNLARRIAAELRRFDVEVDDAAGVPLFQSPAGRLLRQILALTTNGCSAIDLMALLRNRATRFGESRATISVLADDIELGLLRGQRANPGLAGLRQLLAANIGGTTAHPARRLHQADSAPINALFDQIEAALAPLFALLAQSSIDASALASALCAAFDAVANGAEILGRRELTEWARQMASLSGEGHVFQPRHLDGVLTALMLGAQVRTQQDRRSDIAIWGQLEARLQNPDLLILAALNEDKWPEPADPGTWLSRGMRLAAGLSPPEWRQGLAAHDFAQAVGNAEVIIAYADRVGSSPAIASRLLQRLQAFAGVATAAGWQTKGAHWLEQARRLDAVDQTQPASRPAPNPPASTRPRALSVTEIETLMRSPYDVYAKHILRLRPLDPLGDSPDSRERGTIIHDIFAEFVDKNCDVMAPDAIDMLMVIAAEKFAGLDAIGERRDIWLRRFHTAAAQFLDFERARDPMVAQRHAEIDGELSLHLKESFTLRGRADRIDVLNDGTLEIIDFKTGSLPTKDAMQAFEVPQLLLEAQIAQAGTLKHSIAPAPTSVLTYIKVGLGPDAFIAKPFLPAEGFDLMAAADEITMRMQRHVELFLMADTPMPARLLPLPGQRFAGAYDHLARLAEWTAVDGGEGES